MRVPSPAEGSGPAPVTLWTEELDPLDFVVDFVVALCPGESGGVIGELALVDNIAHRIEESVARHGHERSREDPMEPAVSSAPGAGERVAPASAG